MKKKPAIEIAKMGGLKCDNTDCDWSDMSIKVEFYKKYINYKCPKCGDNVFTKKDYITFKLLIGVIKIINFILPKRVSDDEKDTIMTCVFGKDGKINSCTIKN